MSIKSKCGTKIKKYYKIATCLGIILSILIIFSFKTIEASFLYNRLLDYDKTVTKLETRNVNIDDENIPKEVKLSIEKLKKNPKNKNIRIEKTEYKINNNQLGLNTQKLGIQYIIHG